AAPSFVAQRHHRERALIEEALRKTRGRVSGPFGAAARLGLPASTLESRIRSLGIDKASFLRVDAVPRRPESRAPGRETIDSSVLSHWLRGPSARAPIRD